MTDGKNLVRRSVRLGSRNTLRLGGRACPWQTEVRVIARIKQVFDEKRALVVEPVIHLDRHVIGGQAAADCSKKVVAELSAAAGALLQRINEIRRREARRIVRGQRVDTARRNDVPRKRSAM